MSELHSRRSLIHKLAALSVFGATSASGSLFDRRRLRVEHVHVPVPGLPARMDGFRIAQISDLHMEPLTTAEEIQSCVDAVMAIQPDMIAMTGDFMTNNTKAMGRLGEILAQLEAPYGVHASLGNHDFWSGAPEVERVLKERKIPVLRNTTKRIHTDKGSLYLGGIDSVYVEKPDVRKTLQDWQQSQPLVLLMHEPDAADVIAAAGVKALQLSGHTHGGQLLFGGKHPSPIRRARFGKRYLSGHYRVGGLELYVNRGIGCVGVPLRIGCPPEVTELTLRSPEVLRAQMEKA